MIEDKLDNIIKINGKSIIVLVGFKKHQLPDKNKYLSINIEYYDKLNDDIIAKIKKDTFENVNFQEPYKWMTVEEYYLAKDYLVFNEIPIIVLKNNLYDKQYPYDNSLSDIDSIYQSLYYQVDTELHEDQEKLLKNISKFYGKIDYSKQSGKYFVTYPEFDSDIKCIDYYKSEPVTLDYSIICPSKDVQRIELSEDEIPFLDMESEIIDNTSKRNVLLVISGEEKSLPNKYLERLGIILSLAKVNFFFEQLSMKANSIKNFDAYLEILKKVYNYDHYLEIKFYKNIENQSKETIDISQAQIIDDIVTQAENAINGEPFRDIYITASTGSGKSIMFQVPSFYLVDKYPEIKPLTIVISPLIGLMQDQINSMRKRGINTFATINGNTLPNDKEQILNKLNNKEVNVLYISPETLQSRSNIKTLIGDRSIGAIIVDEAHIVTTWGKSFRADYWYLGIYLSKLRKEYKFPIITFTATSIYGGREDMYLDTRNSLNMISPISYFGVVRRNDLYMKVRSSEKDLDSEGRDYRKTKNTLALNHLKFAEKQRQKSLLYFPTVKLLTEFYNFVNKNSPEIAKKTGKYFGNLKKEEKDEVLLDFKNGDIQFVLATKAFGMGIDIPDITNVYHYAPTGNVVDYVQEIGRAARDKSKVKYGFGIIDFLSKDMNEVKRLYGMSAIKKTQILEVIRKILSIYQENGNNRNMIISPEDFKYIFVQNDQDVYSLDNKVKTVLLMIEKDFSSSNKLGYSPFVARPRSLFGNDLIFVKPEYEKMFLNSRIRQDITQEYKLNNSMYSAIYKVNLSDVWEKYYKRLSFPEFKHNLFTLSEVRNLEDGRIFEKFIYTSGISIVIGKNDSIENLISEYRKILGSFETFIDQFMINGRQFNIIDLGNHFGKSLKIADRFEARAFAQTIINAAFEFNKIERVKFISERKNSSEDNPLYTIHQSGDIFKKFILSSLNSVLYPKNDFIKEGKEFISFYPRSYKGNGDFDAKIAALGIGEAREMLNYQVLGGNNPQIYLRMNSIYPLQKAIQQGDFYQNSILNDVQVRHYTSVEMLKYLFTKEQPELNPQEKIQNYSKWFWDRIEDYFMGIIPNKVKYSLEKNKISN